MRAAVFNGVGLPLSLADIQIDEPAAQEVLVRVVAVGLCHSDLHALDGILPVPAPTVLGHEVAGVVERVGSAVATVRPGDHVVVCLSFHCGSCAQCLGGHANRCDTPGSARPAGSAARLTLDGQAVYPFAQIGGFAEQVLVHESGCVLIPREMPLDRACLISCGVTTGFGAAVRTAAIRPGDNVAVIGCGGVGLAAVNGAAVAGAGTIAAIDRLPHKAEMARAFGAHEALHGTPEEVIERVMALTSGRGVDHAIEAIGLPQTVSLAFALLAKGGTATIAGVIGPGVKVELPGIDFLREKRVQGSLMGGVRPAIDIPRYVDFYRDGRLKLDELISRRRPLQEINDGMADLRAGEAARTVMMVGEV